MGFRVIRVGLACRNSQFLPYNTCGVGMQKLSISALYISVLNLFLKAHIILVLKSILEDKNLYIYLLVNIFITIFYSL